MPRIAQKSDEVLASDCCCHRVDQRMMVQPFILHQIGIEYDCHAVTRIVDCPKGVTDPGDTPQTSVSNSAEPNETLPAAPMIS